MQLFFGLALLAATAGVVMGNMQNGAEWRELGELPDASGGAAQSRNIGMGGPFAGVHGDALIVAGGSNFPIGVGDNLWSAPKVLYDRIWVATRAHAAHAASTLMWHEITTRLPTPRAHGATVSHRLGVFLLGGTDGTHATSDALLLRWDAHSGRLAMYRLPPMPAPSMEGGAAVIGDSLYVVAGSNGTAETADLFAFDLRQIDVSRLDDTANDNGQVPLLLRTKDNAGQRSPWTRLASIPDDAGHSMARSKMMVAAQSDGRQTRLFVIGGQRVVTPQEYADAVPIGLDENDPHLHFYDDVWAYTPAETGSGQWQRMRDVGIDGDRGGRAAGSAIALGGSEILLISSGKGDLLRKVYGELRLGWENYTAHPGFERRSLIYDVKTDRWRAGPLAPMMADPMIGNGHLVAASAVTTQAVCWNGEVVLPSGEARPRVRSPKIWAIDTAYLKAKCSAVSPH